MAGRFASMNGYVVTDGEDGTHLIDLDGSQGVSVGDLFTVTGPGRPITHPVTGASIGPVETSKGILKVTRLKTGYSHARVVEKTAPILRGDPVRRFEGIPAIFQDRTGRGAPVFHRLRNLLPHLDWKAYQHVSASDGGSAPKYKAALFFVLNADGIEVRDSETDMLHASAVPPVVRPAPEESLPETAPPDPRTKPPAGKPSAVAPEYPDSEIIGTWSETIRVADFIRHDGRLLMASALGGLVDVCEVGTTLRHIGKIKGPSEEIYAIRWWKPIPNGDLYLAAAGWARGTVDSSLYILKGDGLELFKESIPFILGAFDMDGDGAPETLLRQSFDRDTFWGGRIQKLDLKGTDLDPSEVDLELPRGFPVAGSAFADLTGDGRPESIFLRGGVLTVFTGKKKIHEAPGMGGGVSILNYEINPGQQAALSRTQRFEIPPAIADIDGDGVKEIIAIAAASPMFSIPGLLGDSGGRRIAVIDYRDGNFRQAFLGGPTNHPVQGLTVDGRRVLRLDAGEGSRLHACPIQ